MISDYLLGQIAQETMDKIKGAEVVLDGETKKAVLLRKDLEGSLLKVYVQMSTGSGDISDVRLVDDKGKVLISKPKGIVKTTGYAIVSSFYIRFKEEEVDEPVSIFELRGGQNG